MPLIIRGDLPVLLMYIASRREKSCVHLLLLHPQVFQEILPSNFQQQRLDDYEHKFKKIDHQLVRLQVEGRKSFNDLDFHIAQPLFQRILDEPILSQFKMLQMEPYDGSTDLIDHLESYKTLMMIQGTTNILICIDFSTTIRKAARA